jgi:hypothetical protein
MPLTMRPTGLGAGIDKDRQDFSVELWRVNSPFSVLAGRTRVRKQAVRASVRLGWVASFTRPISRGHVCRATTPQRSSVDFVEAGTRLLGSPLSLSEYHGSCIPRSVA